MKRFLLVLSLIATAVAPASAQSVAGDWNAGMNTPGGSSSFKLFFQVKGDSVSGTVFRSSGEVPLRGAIKSDTLRFSYVINYNDQSLVVGMVARVAGDSMMGTVTFNGGSQDAFWARRLKEVK
jgi:hypothetical protein